MELTVYDPYALHGYLVLSYLRDERNALWSVVVGGLLGVLAVAHQGPVELGPHTLPAFGEKYVVLRDGRGGEDAGELVARLDERAYGGALVALLGTELALHGPREASAAVVRLDVGYVDAVTVEHIGYKLLGDLHRLVCEDNVDNVSVLRCVDEVYGAQAIRAGVRRVGHVEAAASRDGREHVRAVGTETEAVHQALLGCRVLHILCVEHDRIALA